jgi:putative ABC transport system permease protein
VNLQTRLALRYLAGRRQRTVLTTLAIVLGVMIIFGFGGLLPVFENSFRLNLMASAGQVDLTVTSRARGVFDAAAVEVVGGVPGVLAASGSLVQSIVLPAREAPTATDGKAIVTLLINGVDTEAPSVRPLAISRGRALGPNDGNVVLVSDALAERTGLEPGTTLRLPSASGVTVFEVVGVVTGPPLPGVEPVYMPLAAAQSLFNLAGQINTVEAVAVSDADVEAVRTAVLTALGPEYKLGGNEAGSEFAGAMNMGRVGLNFMGILALAMGGFVIHNTFRTAVLERRRDIGMLRSLGATRRTVLGLVLTESLAQGVIGTALGLILGYLMVLGLLAALAPLAEQMWRFPLGDPSFSLGTYATSITLGLGVTLAGGLEPALSATRVSPLEALRPSMGELGRGISRRRLVAGTALGLLALAGLVSGDASLSSLGVLAFLVAVAVVGPALVQPISKVFGGVLAAVFAREGRIAQGNLVRHPGRAAVTVSSIMIGLTVIVALAGLATSLSSGVVNYVDASLGEADYLLMPESVVLGGGNVGAGPGLVEAVRGVPGVTEVTTLRLATTRTAAAGGQGGAGSGQGGADLQVIGIDPALYPRLSGLVFARGDAAEAYASLGAGRAVILNAMFATQTGLQVGQDLTLLTPDGSEVYRVVGVASDFLNAKLATGYISTANLELDFRQTGDVVVMIKKAEGADPTAVKAALEDAVRGYPAFTLFAVSEWRESMLGYSEGAMSAFFVLMLVLAVPSLLALMNTLGINVLERTRELGMLRAVGATRRQVRRVIVAESLLLSAAGAAFGLLGGVWLGYAIVSALSASVWPLPYFFPYTGLVVASAAALFIGVVAALIPARQAARLNVVTALHYE